MQKGTPAEKEFIDVSQSNHGITKSRADCTAKNITSGQTQDNLTMENVIFDIEKEIAIKEIVNQLRARETQFCIGLAEVLKKRLFEEIIALAEQREKQNK